jgi:LPS sulfotransferase NodH
MKPVRFVVLSSPRTGSSLFVEALHQHPAIYCHGEIFHEMSEWHIRPEFIEKIGIGERQENGIKFAYSILNFSNGCAAVGFKMWIFQHKDACMALLGDPNVKKIILKRDNKLAMFASEQLAISTGIWDVVPGVPIDKFREKNKAKFMRQAFLGFVDHQAALFDSYRQHAVGDVLEIEYSDVANLRLGPIFTLLNVESVPLHATKQRIYSADIMSRFEPQYSDEIKEVLAEIGKQNWAAEDL